MLTKKDLAETLGLSCVEKYFLAWLGKYYDVSELYADSFVGLSRLFDSFACGATYENYCDIERLQDLSEAYGIVKHKYISCSANEAAEIISAKKEEELLLIRVNTSFFLNFKRSSWREDHYICLNNDLSWINEYPLSEGKFDRKEFEKIYDGALCIYSLGDLNITPISRNKEAVCNQCFEELPKVSLEKFEGALGIFRISRKRLLIAPDIPRSAKEILSEEIKLADKLYFATRLKQVKRVKGEKPELVATESDLKTIIEYEKRLREKFLYDDGKKN